MSYGLICRDEKVEKAVALKNIDIVGSLLAEFMQVKILQKFKNDSQTNAEFIYTFPMPDKASICGFTAKIGERLIKGAVKEKEQAFKEYDAAVRQGDSAFLLESHRVNVFQVSLGQVAPMEDIDIEIEYIEEIKAVDGEMRILIPTLVAPRYIPGKQKGKKLGMGMSFPTDSVPDADFITPPIGEAPYKAKINICVNAGRKITSMKSPSHNIKVDYIENDNANILLADEQTSLDRDFIVNIKVFGEQISKYIYGKTEKDESFAYVSVTPELPVVEKVDSLKYIFLVDVSGSMSGQKLKQAKEAIKICLRNLTELDTFNMAAFESNLHAFSKTSLSFNQVNLDKATAWIEKLTDMGGTEILPAVQFALSHSSKSEKIVMLFTDGQVGNEEEIIRFVKAENKNIRLYSMGIDTSVNSHFINKIAEAGNGSAEFVYPGENLDDKVIRQFSRINSSWLNDVKVEIDGINEIDIAGGIPKRLYDMESTSLIFKLSMQQNTQLDTQPDVQSSEQPIGNVRISGLTGKDEISILVGEALTTNNTELIERLWAKRKIEELETYLTTGNPRRHEGVQSDIVKISERYGVISSLTSFVAVYKRENKLSGLPETIVVPVSEPHGWGMLKEEGAEFKFLSRSKAVMPSIFGVVGGASVSKAKCYSPIVSFNEVSNNVQPILEENTFRTMLSKTDMRHEALKNIDKKSSNGSIKTLAVKQNSDGSFGDEKIDNMSRIMETVKALITFTTSSEDIMSYRSQIRKAIDYIVIAEDELIKDLKLVKLSYIAIELCSLRKIVAKHKGSECLQLKERLKMMLNGEEEFEEVLVLIESNDIEGIKLFVQ